MDTKRQQHHTNEAPISDQETDLDIRLVTAIAAGSGEALGRLYDRHANRVLGVALAILRSRRDAEDLLHDVFIEVWQKAKVYDRTRGPVAYWLTLRTRSRAIDRQRAQHNRNNFEEQAASDANRLAATAREQVDKLDVYTRLENLPEEQRQAMCLAYIHGYTSKEIAALMDVPEPTVKSRLQRGLVRMRRYFDQQAAI